MADTSAPDFLDEWMLSLILGRRVRRFLFLHLLVFATAITAPATSWVSHSASPDAFPIVANGKGAAIRYSTDDHAVVGIAARDLSLDVERVTGLRLPLNEVARDQPIIYIGTLGHSEAIDRMADAERIDVTALEGAWESFIIATVSDPEPGVEQGLVIAGSDRRGTAFGVYELAAAIGVSPWHWWADVPAKRADELWVKAGEQRFGPPSVQYRGIFINDEDWGLHPWASQTFDPELGDIGPKTYQKVFELMLRLKANTLWPAMHEVTRAFNLYPENKLLADRYGIVMASSHAEPMLRNNVTEWQAPKSEYNYATHRESVLDYWEQRLEVNGAFENVYSLGMRGIHDSGITAGTTTEEKVTLLERIIADQRALLAKHVNHDLQQVPQAFTPYKEVLELYQAGLDVPDDVMLVWPDDNHGFIRRLPSEAERERSGGAGVYYHLSYLGAPMAYLWLYTTPPALVWEEMSKAYDLGAREYWIVNVGDIKPGELGMEFFLEMAWDIDRWNLDTLADFLPQWSEEVFGAESADRITSALELYFQLNYQRRPEHLQWWPPHGRATNSPLTSLEARDRLAAFDSMLRLAEEAERDVLDEAKDAFFQLVEYPLKGAALANRRYFHAEQYGRLFNADPSAARIHGALARHAHEALQELTWTYNEEVANGKWRRIIAEEPADNMWRSFRLTPPILPAPNLVADLSENKVDLDTLRFAGYEGNRASAAMAEVEREAEDYDRSHSTEAEWKAIPGLGRTGDSIGGFPVVWKGVDEARASEAPFVEYDLGVSSQGEYDLYVNLIPTFPINGRSELRFGAQLDDGPIDVVRVKRETGDRDWAKAVLSGSITAKVKLAVDQPGAHRLRLYLLDPGVIVDKWFLHPGSLSERFLGPSL